MIRRIAEEEKGELELLVIGPMTNIAIAISLYPQLKKQIKHIWFMGGAAKGGNVSATAEFNIWVDPIAAKLVMSAGIPMTMVGLDVTEKAVLGREEEKELREYGSKASVLTADILEYMFKRCKGGGEDALMHDALALAAAVIPECLECRENLSGCGVPGRVHGGTHGDRRLQPARPSGSQRLGGSGTAS